MAFLSVLSFLLVAVGLPAWLVRRRRRPTGLPSQPTGETDGHAATTDLPRAARGT